MLDIKRYKMVNCTERGILNLLTVFNESMTTQRIADRMEIDWGTARRHLGELEEQKLVTKKTEGRITFWSAVK